MQPIQSNQYILKKFPFDIDQDIRSIFHYNLGTRDPRDLHLLISEILQSILYLIHSDFSVELNKYKTRLIEFINQLRDQDDK